MGVSKTLRRWCEVIGCLAVLIGCSSDEVTGPKVTGHAPAYLEGVWSIQDAIAPCSNTIRYTRTFNYMDTICASTLDFVNESVQTVWLMYLQRDTLYPACSYNYLEPEIQSCSGVISDTLINVLCNCTVQHYLEGEDCYIDLLVSIRGLPNDNEWQLLRSIEYLEKGYDCGFTPWDSLYECYSFVSTMDRIGDAPEGACGGELATSISGNFYQRREEQHCH
jgi:hypothetical protein